MNQKNKDRLSFGLGLAAGLFVGYYLSSQEGQELRKRVQQRLLELSEDLGLRVQEQFDNLSEYLDAFLNKGEEMAEAAKENIAPEVEEAGENAGSFVADARSSFLRGMERARRTVEQRQKNGMSEEQEN